MRKIIGIVLFSNILAMPTFAFENYIISSESPVVSIENKTPTVFDVKPLTTLMNERDTMIFQALKEGDGEFVVNTEDGKSSVVKVNIKKDVTTFKTNSNLECIILDDIPEEYELDLPPEVKWNR